MSVNTYAKAVVIASVLLGGSGAFAQAPAADTAAEGATEGLADIVVTARRESESLQKAPVAVTAISNAAIEAAGVFRPTKLGEAVPGLRAQSSGADRENVIFNIRGQGFEFLTLFPAVIPYFAEVPLQSLTNGQFYDLESLQVLRGPQGVRFGRVTNGGAILLAPKRPDGEFGGNVEIKGGNHSLRGANGAMTLPIVPEILSVRAAFEVMKRDGYTRNLVTGRKLDDMDHQSFRVGALLTPADGFENYAVYQHFNQKTNGTSISITRINPNALLPIVLNNFGAEFAQSILSQFNAALERQRQRGPRIVENGNLAWGPDGGIRGHRKTRLFVNTTTLDISDEVTLKNIFGYLRYKQRSGTDADGTGLAIIDLPNRFVPERNGRQLSNELQLNAKLFGDVLNLTIGGFADSQKTVGLQERDIIQFTILQSPQTLLTTTTSRAIYGNGEIDLGQWVEGFKINGGIRRTRDTVRGRSLNLTGLIDPNRPRGVCVDYLTFTCNLLTGKFYATTYEVGASYSTGKLFFYGSYRKGYRPGGVSSIVDPRYERYQPEYNEEFEIGAKLDFSLGTVPARLNVAAFSDNYTGIQRSTNVNIGGIQQTVVTNIADARVKGIEYEATIIPAPGLQLTAKGAYTDAKYKRGTQDLFGPTGACNRDSFSNIGFCTLNRFVQTPKHTVAIGVQYRLPVDEAVGRITIGGDWYHQSSMALHNSSYISPGQIQERYSLINLNAGWEGVAGMPIDIRLFATNLTNKLYRESTTPLFQKSSLGFDADTYAEPRMYGVSLKYRFGSEG